MLSQLTFGFRRRSKIDFQDGCLGSHLGFPIWTILATCNFDLQVITIPFMKFQVSWTFSSGVEVQNRFSTRYRQNIRKCYRANMKSNSKTGWGDNSKWKKPKLYVTLHLILFYISQSIIRVISLVHNMSSCPVLHFYQISSKYSEGYSSNRADMK